LQEQGDEVHVPGQHGADQEHGGNGGAAGGRGEDGRGQHRRGGRSLDHGEAGREDQRGGQRGDRRWSGEPVLLAAGQPEDQGGQRPGDQQCPGHVEALPAGGPASRKDPQAREHDRDQRRVDQEHCPPAKVLGQQAADDDPRSEATWTQSRAGWTMGMAEFRLDEAFGLRCGLPPAKLPEGRWRK